MRPTIGTTSSPPETPGPSRLGPSSCCCSWPGWRLPLGVFAIAGALDEDTPNRPGIRSEPTDDDRDGQPVRAVTSPCVSRVGSGRVGTSPRITPMAASERRPRSAPVLAGPVPEVVRLLDKGLRNVRGQRQEVIDSEHPRSVQDSRVRFRPMEYGVIWWRIMRALICRPISSAKRSVVGSWTPA